MHRRFAFVIVPLIAIMMLAALAPGPVVLKAQASKTVAVIDSTFQPANLSIAAGTTVTWTSSEATPHTSTSDGAHWDSGQLSSQSFARTFTTPGTYAYHCTFHPQTMRGTITVVAPIYLPLALGPHTADGSTPTASVQPSATATTKPSPTSTIQPSPTATGTSTPTATEVTPSQYGLRGQVQVRPRWATTTTETIPTLYEIVLDASGSMNWDMAGQSGNASNPITCPANPICSNQVWEPVEERRIYIAKQAINGLIDKMGPDDLMQITSFSGELSSNFGTQRAITNLTLTLPSGGWSNNTTELKNAVSTSGSTQGDPYRTIGLAPSATALAAAAQMFATAPITAPNGLAYKRNVIFLTDSVANVFLDGQRNYAMDICPIIITSWDIAACQVGVAAGGRPRPISAMVEQADALKQLAHIYVVALAGVDETGLISVASAPSYPFFSTAQSDNELGAIMDDIWSGMRFTTCTPAGGNAWVSQIDAQHTATFPPPNTLPDGVLGYVYLYDEYGAALPAGQHMLPITHDALSGTSTFELPQSHGLEQGIYLLRAFAGYKGDDGVSRAYDSLYNQDNGTIDVSQIFVVDPASATGPLITLDPVNLDLQPETQLCP